MQAPQSTIARPTERVPAYLQKSLRNLPVKAVVRNVGGATLEELCADAASSHIKVVEVMIVLPLQQSGMPVKLQDLDFSIYTLLRTM